MQPLIQYGLATSAVLPPFQGPLYEYWLAGNGVFVRGEREGLTALLPVAPARPGAVRGLADLAPTVALAYPRVPAEAVACMVRCARGAASGPAGPLEALFHLEWQPASARWHLAEPAQERGPTHVRPTDTGPDSTYSRCILEVHSHHRMRAFWSETDNADEQGFRLYGVLGTIVHRPVLRVRVGLYGVFWELPPQQIFELPHNVAERPIRADPPEGVAA